MFCLPALSPGVYHLWPTLIPPCPRWQVALQRRMFEEYERRERRRKVAELLEVCPDLGEDEAERALQLCDGRWGWWQPSGFVGREWRWGWRVVGGWAG